MNRQKRITLSILALCALALLVPLVLAQGNGVPTFSSPLPTLPPWCEDVGNVQPCLPWRPTPRPPATPTPTPGVPPEGTAPGLRLYLPLVTSHWGNP